MNFVYLLRSAFIVAILVLAVASAEADEKPVPARQVAAKIDGFLESHWSVYGIQPTNPADDATFLRRVTLDLVGRIPATSELDQFLHDKSNDKRRKLIEKLTSGPEFPLHFGNVLDQMIQGGIIARCRGRDGYRIFVLPGRCRHLIENP